MPERRQRLSILYVGTLPPHPGGSAISGSELLVALARLGHTIRALAPITAATLRSGDQFAAAHPEIGVTRYVLPYFESSLEVPAPDAYRMLERDRLLERLRLLIGDERPQLIVIGRESFAWDVPRIAKSCSVPCVLRASGSVTTMGIVNRTYPAALVHELLQQYRIVDLIVTPARHMAESLDRLGLKNVRSIPNAVDLQRFCPESKDGELLRQLTIREDDIVVAHVANLRALKRPLDLVHSAAEALRQNPRLVYMIVGDGVLRGHIEDACRRERIHENFRFTGWVDYERVPAYVNLADVMVMPSEAEGLARVYLETQACGRTLLASDIPAARDVITDGETGLLFRKGDIEDLTAKTLLAAGDRALRADIGRKARNQAERRPLDRLVDEYASAFESLVGERRG